MIEDFYTESVSVLSRSTAVSGVSQETWSTSANIEAFMAALNPMGGNALMSGDRRSILADYKLFCSDTVSFYERDRLKWGNTTFAVVFIKDTLDKAHHKNVLLKRLNV